MWLVIGLLIVGLALIFVGDRYLGDTLPVVFKAGGVIMEILFAILAVVALVSYSVSLDTVADVESFSARNHRIFATAVAEYPGAVTVRNSNGATETVRLSWEYVEQVLAYNENLLWYRKYQDHWFLGIFITSVADNLEFIELALPRESVTVPPQPRGDSHEGG